MLTIDELIEALADRGHAVSRYDLQNWQQGGVIPHGIRRRHNGATRLLYPRSQIDRVEWYLEIRKLGKDAMICQILTLLPGQE